MSRTSIRTALLQILRPASAVAVGAAALLSAAPAQAGLATIPLGSALDDFEVGKGDAAIVLDAEPGYVTIHHGQADTALLIQAEYVDSEYIDGAGGPGYLRLRFVDGGASVLRVAGGGVPFGVQIEPVQGAMLIVEISDTDVKVRQRLGGDATVIRAGAQRFSVTGPTGASYQEVRVTGDGDTTVTRADGSSVLCDNEAISDSADKIRLRDGLFEHELSSIVDTAGQEDVFWEWLESSYTLGGNDWGLWDTAGQEELGGNDWGLWDSAGRTLAFEDFGTLSNMVLDPDAELASRWLGAGDHELYAVAPFVSIDARYAASDAATTQGYLVSLGSPTDLGVVRIVSFVTTPH